MAQTADAVWLGVGLLVIALCALGLVRQVSDWLDARRATPSRPDRPPSLS